MAIVTKLTAEIRLAQLRKATGCDHELELTYSPLANEWRLVYGTDSKVIDFIFFVPGHIDAEVQTWIRSLHERAES